MQIFAVSCDTIAKTQKYTDFSTKFQLFCKSLRTDVQAKIRKYLFNYKNIEHIYFTLKNGVMMEISITYCNTKAITCQNNDFQLFLAK